MEQFIINQIIAAKICGLAVLVGILLFFIIGYKRSNRKYQKEEKLSDEVIDTIRNNVEDYDFYERKDVLVYRKSDRHYVATVTVTEPISDEEVKKFKRKTKE